MLDPYYDRGGTFLAKMVCEWWRSLTQNRRNFGTFFHEFCCIARP